MITKSASDVLDKYAFLEAWEGIPNGIRGVARKAAPAAKASWRAAKATSRGLKKVVDTTARGLGNTGKYTATRPKVMIPALLAAAVGYNALDKSVEYDARIVAPNSGITKRTPFTGSINFSDPSYRKFYE